MGLHCVGKGICARKREASHEESVRVFQRLFPGERYTALTSYEQEQKKFDPFLFDGNRRLMYRVFEPDEQYYEYDALREKLEPVSVNRVGEVKRNYKDLMRISLSWTDFYWEEEKDGRPRPAGRNFRPMNPELDVVPTWNP